MLITVTGLVVTTLLAVSAYLRWKSSQAAALWYTQSIRDRRPPVKNLYTTAVKDYRKLETAMRYAELKGWPVNKEKEDG